MEISDNAFPSSDLEKLTKFSKLQSLSVGNNNIANLEDVKVLKALGELKQLDLSENEVVDVEGYRDAIFEAISSLTVRISLIIF